MSTAVSHIPQFGDVGVFSNFGICLIAWLGGKARKGKEKNGEKVACVGVEPAPSAIWAVVLSQLD